MNTTVPSALNQRQVFSAWWPLAASWLLMGTEMSLVSAAIARFPDAAFHLAAFGGLVFPVALLIEAPIIMMLAASTALSTDRRAFRTLKKFSTTCGLALSALHALIAFTPLYDIVLVGLIDPPEGAIEPGRIWMQWMTLWTWAIADRRFHQGLLIRFERSRTVVIGTLVRLCVMVGILAVGMAHGEVPGIAVACCALSSGVVAEMIATRVFAKPIITGPLASAPLGQPLTLRRLLSFYVPLAITPILNLMALPIGSASISRMAMPLENHAAWPPVNGLIFMARSVGIAFNEVVVSLSDRPGAHRALNGFAVKLTIATSAILTLIAFTPLSTLWFDVVSGLEPDILSVAKDALPLGVLLPGLTVLISLYTGRLVSVRKTRAIPESVGLCLLVTVSGLFLGVTLNEHPGVQVALTAFTLGVIAQILWLRFRQEEAEPIHSES